MFGHSASANGAGEFVEVRYISSHIRLAKKWTPAEFRSLPARLGEHSVDVLRETGFSDGEIDQLLDEGVTIDGAVSGQRDAAE